MTTATAQAQEQSSRSADSSDRSRWIALYVLCVGLLMMVLDATVVNVALPSIQEDLGFTQSSLAWVLNAYLISFGGLLLLAGRLGDILGRKNVFMYGLGLFTVASIVCGAAQSQELLVAARFVQGIGGAMTSAVILGMIVTMFPEPREQAKAIGVYGFVAAAGGSIGLLAGGLLTQAINWHWIFFINIPIGIATAALAQKYIAKDAGIGFGQGADALGALLITSALVLGVYTIVKPAAEQGWTSTTTLGLGAVSLGLLAAFLVREGRIPNPLMPLRIFKSRNVAGANLVCALLMAGMFGMFFLSTLYLQKVQGYDALHIGLAFLPNTLIMGVLSLRYSDALIARFGAKSTLVPGIGLVVAGLALFSLAPVEGNYVVHVLPAMLLIGVGVGVAFPALMTLAMSGATEEDAGLASGFINTTTEVGAALGLAVLATLSATRTEHLVGGGPVTRSALTSGYQLAFVIAAVLSVAALVVAVVVLRSDKQPADEPVAAEQGGCRTEPCGCPA